jgi:cyclopropane fatty-acyl-phospholipid synthase-like methyltransferase
MHREFLEVNYKEYVGREDEFDFSAASQFSLLFHFGLRENSKVLDFGCGCLRLGRLLIPFLENGNYFGYDPNPSLYEQFIKDNSYNEIVNFKSPHLMSTLTGNSFDFIIAHSVFTHTGVDLFDKYISDLKSRLSEKGFILATFYVSSQKSNQKNGWRYKECYAYTDKHIKSVASKNDLLCERLNWWHPRQIWYSFSFTAFPSLFLGKPVQNTENMVIYKKDGQVPEKYTPSDSC